MSKRIYVDTNIYIDLFENRSDKLVPWAEFAHQLFERTISCEFEIISSAWILKELKKNGYKKQAEELFNKLSKNRKLIYLEVRKHNKKEARKVKGVHYDDNLHYVMAKKGKAEIIVTRNWKDFYEFKDIIVLPAEFL